MDDLAASEATAFNPDAEVEPICMKCIDAHLKDQQYDENRVAHWTNYILEDIMQGLAQLNKPFKYIGMYFCFDCPYGCRYQPMQPSQ